MPCARSTSRRVLAAAAAALILAPACERPLARESLREHLRSLGRPHLVLVVVDTLRPDWTTPYDTSRNTAPELQRWSQRGVVFEHALSQSSWTKVSMASLMTSLWPRTHRITQTDDALSNSALTLAEVLAQGGYHTVAVQSNGWLEQTFGFHQGFDRYMFPRGGGSAVRKTSVWPHADNVHAEVVRLLENADPDVPLFLYLHLMDVHEYGAPPEFKLYGTDAAGDYLAAIRWVDDAIERVREALDREGFLDRAVLVFTSDHGEAFGENGSWGHARNSLTATLRVPLLIRFPFPVEPLRIGAQVRNLDVAPTLVDLAGLSIPDSFRGSSLLPLIEGSEPERHRPNFASLHTRLYRDATLQESTSDGRWTFVRNLEDGTELLFDRRVDPGENVNLVEIESQAAARLRSALDANAAEAPEAGAVQHDVRIDPSLANKLRALGYAP
jgi:arylsulfatase A-like enzyme